jgi:hypothetical protein
MRGVQSGSHALVMSTLTQRSVMRRRAGNSPLGRPRRYNIANAERINLCLLLRFAGTPRLGSF